MDVALYLIAAAVLIVLIGFAVKIRSRTQEGKHAEMEEREERKRMQELREQERQQEDERERLMEQKQVTNTHTHKLQLCAGVYSGGGRASCCRGSRNLLQEFIQHIEVTSSCSVVLLEDLASHFGMRTQDAINRLQDLLAEGSLTGVIDDRGKFISITPEELDSVARFIRQRGHVSITELAQASNSLINLQPESRSSA
uniref:DDRGK domain-containing protein 1 n=1 Tax=Labrus bergylta TaxID=56723 RepID=A0A3Q3FXP6_9LABR